MRRKRVFAKREETEVGLMPAMDGSAGDAKGGARREEVRTHLGRCVCVLELCKGATNIGIRVSSHADCRRRYVTYLGYCIVVGRIVIM